MLHSTNLVSNEFINRAVNYIVKDYLQVIKQTSLIKPDSLPLDINLEHIKPFTMLNILVSNELNVNNNKRVDCASLVNISGTIITFTDDLLDEDYKSASRIVKFDASHSKVEQYTSIDLLNSIMYNMLYTHIRGSSLTLDNYAELIRCYNLYKYNKMYKGAEWQKKYGLFNKLEGEFPSFDIFFEEYVDNVTGSLMAWSIDAIRYYSNDIKDQIDKLLPGIYSLGRVIQINDDINDIIYDLNKSQYNTAILAILNNGREEEKDKLEAISSEYNYKLRSDEFKKYFPQAYKILEEIKLNEFTEIHKVMNYTGLSVSYDELVEFIENYQSIRRFISEELMINE